MTNIASNPHGPSNPANPQSPIPQRQRTGTLHSLSSLTAGLCVGLFVRGSGRVQVYNVEVRPPNGPGNALSLDGVSDYVAPPAGVWFNGDFTIEGWVFVRSHNNWARLLECGNGEYSGNVQLTLSYGTSGRPHCNVLPTDAPVGPGVLAPDPLPLNQWTHLACTLSGAAVGADVSGRFQSGGFNLIGILGDNTVALGFTQPTDIVGQSPARLDPRLGALDFFGGTTLVLSLLPDSPAIDKGHATGAAADQRGQPRPGDQPAIPNALGGDGSDIGAYEVAPPAILGIRHGAPTGGVNTVVLFWPNPSTGYVLQQTPNMNASGGDWVDVTQTPIVNGAFKEVTLPATGQMCLFHLRRS